MDDDMQWMAECSVECAMCGRWTGSALHLCGFMAILVDESCANLCPGCVRRMASLVPADGADVWAN